MGIVHAIGRLGDVILIFTISVILLFTVGAALYLAMSAIRARRTCCVKTVGTVCRFDDGYFYGAGHHYNRIPHPVVTFMANGYQVTAYSPEATAGSKLNVGDQVTLYYNPNNPEMILIPGMSGKLPAACFFAALTILPISVLIQVLSA